MWISLNIVVPDALFNHYLTPILLWLTSVLFSLPASVYTGVSTAVMGLGWLYWKHFNQAEEDDIGHNIWRLFERRRWCPESTQSHNCVLKDTCNSVFIILFLVTAKEGCLLKIFVCVHLSWLEHVLIECIAEPQRCPTWLYVSFHLWD